MCIDVYCLVYLDWIKGLGQYESLAHGDAPGENHER